jgi:DnaK suppressor protein
MNESDKAELRAKLEEELERLEKCVAAGAPERELLSEASGENAYRDHMADQGSATFEREMDMTFEENDRDELTEVREAIKSLDRGTYGTCTRCGAEIPSARLRAVPTTRLCVRCKEKEETR